MIHKTLVLAALPLVFAACAQTKPADVLSDRSPDNPELGIRHIHHGSAIGEYDHREPVEPRPWRRSNDQQSPERDGDS